MTVEELGLRPPRPARGCCREIHAEPITGQHHAVMLLGARAADDTGLGNLTQCRTFEEFKDAAERAYLLGKLREFDWNVSETARAVEMPRSNLYKKIERYALTREHS